jgi:hypothetical protein
VPGLNKIFQRRAIIPASNTNGTKASTSSFHPVCGDTFRMDYFIDRTIPKQNNSNTPAEIADNPAPAASSAPESIAPILYAADCLPSRR